MSAKGLGKFEFIDNSANAEEYQTILTDNPFLIIEKLEPDQK